VSDVARHTADLPGLHGAVSREEVVANCDLGGPGQGLPKPGIMHAAGPLPHREGILLNPRPRAREWPG
jgi:L-cysteate sulfo-lyase